MAQILGLYLYEVAELSGSSQGAVLQGTAGPAFRWKNWGFSYSVLGNGGVGATIDLNAGLALSALGFAGLPAAPANSCGTASLRCHPEKPLDSKESQHPTPSHPGLPPAHCQLRLHLGVVTSLRPRTARERRGNSGLGTLAALDPDGSQLARIML